MVCHSLAGLGITLCVAVISFRYVVVCIFWINMGPRSCLAFCGHGHYIYDNSQPYCLVVAFGCGGKRDKKLFQGNGNKKATLSSLQGENHNLIFAAGGYGESHSTKGSK